MLVLTRSESESIQIGTGADAITVTLVQIFGRKARIGIVAPQHVPIMRSEIIQAAVDGPEIAGSLDAPAFPPAVDFSGTTGSPQLSIRMCRGCHTSPAVHGYGGLCVECWGD